MAGAGIFGDEGERVIQTPTLSSLLNELRDCLRVSLLNFKVDRTKRTVAFEAQVQNIGRHVIFNDVNGIVRPAEFADFDPKEFGIPSLPPGSCCTLGRFQGTIDQGHVMDFLCSAIPVANVSMTVTPSFGFNIIVGSVPIFG